MRALLNPAAGEHLQKLLGMLGSDHAGERAAAALKADEHVRRLGLTWKDVIFVPTPWQRMALACRANLHRLSERERLFVESISRWRRPPTDKQLKWLEDIFRRIEGKGQ